MATAVSAQDSEINPFEAVMSRFDVAAQKLNLDDGLYQFLRPTSTPTNRSWRG